MPRSSFKYHSQSNKNLEVKRQKSSLYSCKIVCNPHVTLVYRKTEYDICFTNKKREKFESNKQS